MKKMDDRMTTDATPETEERPGRIPLGPGTLSLLADVAFASPMTAKLLDAYLTDRGADASRNWRLVLTGAEIVADEGGAPAGSTATPAPASGGAS